MLVLSRKRGQAVRIGDEIVLTIRQIRGNRVRLGFAAPCDVPIYRQEIYEKMQLERSQTDQSQAARSQSDRSQDATSAA